MLEIILVILGFIILVLAYNIKEIRLLSGLGSILIGLSIGNLIVDYIKESQIDYNIKLIQPNSIEITDKHGVRDTIQFEQLEEYILQDNK